MVVNKFLRSVGIATLACIAACSQSTSIGVSRLSATGEITGQVESGTSKVAGAVISIDDAPGTFPAPTAPAAVNQKEKEFLPHVLAVLKGTTVKFTNGDPFFHNVFSNSRAKLFNVSQRKMGDSSNITFDKPGVVRIRCHVHANMKAYIVVLPNPYFDVTSEKGMFHISNVPAGTYTLKVWSEQGTASSQTVQVTAGGNAKVTFKLSQ